MSAHRSPRVLLLGVALLGCYGARPLDAQTVAASQKESDTIRGTVVNSLTHAPIGRALVYSQDNRFATLTDAEGHFELKVPVDKRKSGGPVEVTEEGPIFSVPLMARKPGFVSEENVSVVNVTPGQNATIYLTPEALIVGHVTVADSEGPGRLRVELVRRQVQHGRATWTSAGAVATWSDRQFRFSGLYPGTYKVFTDEWMDRDPLTFDRQGPFYGYPPVYFPGANSFAGGTAIQLRAGVTFNADLSPQRRRYYPVDIPVASAPQGEPAGVEVLAGGQGGPGYSLGYNARAQRIQGWLPDGTYTVEVWSYGPPGAWGAAEISVQGAAATGYTVTLVPDAAIRVNVAEEFTSTEGPGDGVPSSLPSGYVAVNLERADEFGRRGGLGGAAQRQPDAAEDEPLTIEHVMPGRYWVGVYSGRGFAASIKYGDTDLLRQPLVVPPGGLSGPIEVTLRDDFAQIDGFIVESVANVPGSPVNPNARAPHVYLIPSPDSAGQFADIGASPDGKFSPQKLPPGDYQVLAFARPQPDLEYRNAAVMRKYESLGQEIRLVPGQTAHLQLHLISGSE